MIKFYLLKKKKILISVLLIGILSISLYSFVIHPAIRPQYFRNSYDFTLSLRVNGQIGNATFLLPLPVQNGTSKMGAKLLNEEMFRKEGYTISLVPKEQGVYLKIIAPSMTGTNSDVYRANYGNIDFPESDSGFRPINTRHPVGDEPVFLPKDNLTPQKPGSDFSLAWYGFHYNPTITQYQIPLYAGYSATNDTSLEIFAQVSGMNSWEELGTYFSNSYQDTYHLFLHGSSNGWYMADGRMEAGEGKYLDV